MPYYDLRCTTCGREFNQKASVSEFVNRSIACPACQSTTLESVFKRAPATIIKSDPAPAACPHAQMCGGSCPLE